MDEVPIPRPWLRLLAFTLMALALVGMVLLIFNTIDAERREREHVGKTNAILLELRNIGRAAINAETGQHGYFITLDRRYLESYLRGKEQYRPAIARLKALYLPKPEPHQAELLEQIEHLSETKFAEMGAIVELIQNRDLIGARLRILTDDGQDAMARLRHALAEMEQLETQLLHKASEDAANAEARVLPLLISLLAMLLAALLLTFRQVTRAARAKALEAQARSLAQARDRADLLAHELNHRVKNLFAVILAIVRMSAKDRPEAKEVADNIAQRINALLTAHQVTQGSPEKPVADLRELIETTLEPHRSDSERGDIAGPPVMLESKQVTPLGLVLHELATNAAKYGAWSQGGSLNVDWRTHDGSIEVEWTEHCPNGCAAPTGRGFGSQLMDGAARQLQGSIARDFTADGLCVRIVIPDKTSA